ncbi:MAG: protein translocase subunit SecD [Actinobacteria bacterium]|nr:protein translocase subunit SecD [Actinomycetota bacterium]
MSNKQKYTLAIIFVLLMAAGSITLLIIQPPRLGLDLRGGMNVVLTAKSKKGAPVTNQSMDQALYVIEQRINKLGVSEPEISRQGERNILVQLPGIKDTSKALEIIGKTALLEFKEVLKTEKDRYVLGTTLMTGKMLSGAQVGYDNYNKPKVEMTFTKEGAVKFEEITGKLKGKQLAIVLDGKVMSAPNVRDQISGGNAEITGNFTIEEVKKLVLVLQTGALPVQMEISENRTVGPTLGQESLKAGLFAGIIGFVLVALFMLLFYRVFGIITWCSLSIFAILLLGLLSLINQILVTSGSAGISLTLPGIAGIILMVGVAADSSIIIFERIKEEVREGKTMRTAMDTGFSHGFKTFLDADLVTFITAAVLFFLGIGTVKGFAFTLMLGIICDLFISFFFTRAVLGLLGRLKFFNNPVLIGVKGVKTDEV